MIFFFLSLFWETNPIWLKQWDKAKCWDLDLSLWFEATYKKKAGPVKILLGKIKQKPSLTSRKTKPRSYFNTLQFTTTGQASFFLPPKPTPFDGPGDGVLGRLNWRLRPCSPLPSLFRRHNSGQLSMADCSWSPPQASLFRPLRRSSLLPLFWVLFKSPFLGPHVLRLCFHAPLPSPLRLDYFLLGFWLSHWMVSGIDWICFLIGFLTTSIDGVLQIERSDCNCIFHSLVVLYFIECY